ncbi:hypothetical protein N9002_00335 [bacterium]|nr:hypothetical protein [bacterium]
MISVPKITVPAYAPNWNEIIRFNNPPKTSLPVVSIATRFVKLGTITHLFKLRGSTWLLPRNGQTGLQTFKILGH